MTALAMFYYPVILPWWLALWLVLPLTFAVAVVYKTVRTNNLSRLWLEILLLFVYIVVGMCVLGLAAWLILAYWP